MYADHLMSLSESKFAEDLAQAKTCQDLMAVFERKIAGYGYCYFDAGSFEMKTLSEPEKSCRFYLSNYLEDNDPWNYLPKGWPTSDDVVAAMCRSVVPIDYVAFVNQASRTPANLVHMGLLKLWNIRHAWAIPFNSPDRWQFVTVYARNGDEETFQKTRWRMMALGAMLLERTEQVLGAAVQEDSPVGEQLSDRELACLKGIKRGFSNAQIAEDLGISQNTVRFHLKRLFKKLGVRSRTEAALLEL